MSLTCIGAAATLRHTSCWNRLFIHCHYSRLRIACSLCDMYLNRMQLQSLSITVSICLCCVRARIFKVRARTSVPRSTKNVSTPIILSYKRHWRGKVEEHLFWLWTCISGTCEVRSQYFGARTDIQQVPEYTSSGQVSSLGLGLPVHKIWVMRIFLNTVWGFKFCGQLTPFVFSLLAVNVALLDCSPSHPVWILTASYAAIYTRQAQSVVVVCAYRPTVISTTWNWLQAEIAKHIGV